MDLFLKNSFLGFIIFLIIFLSFSFIPVFAQETEQSSNVGTIRIDLSNPINANTIEEVLENIASAIWRIVTPLSAIMLIWAGIQYMTAQGQPDKINQAKNSLKYAIIGIIVALIAGSIDALILAILG
ncbi:MAG: pilin [Candidatus Pacebacteria bacterium]|nr:pilin [Candidatus Paceibacterota bacterium]